MADFKPKPRSQSPLAKAVEDMARRPSPLPTSQSYKPPGMESLKRILGSEQRGIDPEILRNLEQAVSINFGSVSKAFGQDDEARRLSGASRVTSASELGKLVRQARRDMRLSQQAFADLAGLGRRFISELEAGKATLEFDKVLRACAAAGIDLTAAPRSRP